MPRLAAWLESRGLEVMRLLLSAGDRLVIARRSDSSRRRPAVQRRLHAAHGGTGAARCTYRGGDLGLIGQRPLGPQPALRAGQRTKRRLLLATHQPGARHLAVGVACPKPREHLPVLKLSNLRLTTGAFCRQRPARYR